MVVLKPNAGPTLGSGNPGVDPWKLCLSCLNARQDWLTTRTLLTIKKDGSVTIGRVDGLSFLQHV